MHLSSEFSVQSIGASGDDPVSSYFSSISEGHCPYLRQSIAKGLTYLLLAKEVETPSESIGERCFWQSVQVIEVFRERRGELPENIRNLLCFNFCLSHLMPSNSSGLCLFDTQYWMLRCLYTQFGVMVGEFWPDERDIDRFGNKIIPPPFSFFSFRSSILKPDERFIIQAPALREDYMNADVDSRSDPFFWLLGLSVEELFCGERKVRAAAYDKIRVLAEGRRLHGLA